MNKYDITKLAEECGLVIPKEELLETGQMPSSLKYPAFTKAVTSSGGGAWKDQAFICENEGFETTDAGLDTIVYFAEGDMRKAVNVLQAAASEGEAITALP